MTLQNLIDYIEELDAAISDGPWAVKHESGSIGETNDDPGEHYELYEMKCPVTPGHGMTAQGVPMTQPCAAVDDEEAIAELRALADVRNLLFPLARMLRAMQDDEAISDLRSGRGDWRLVDELAHDTMQAAVNTERDE